MRRPGKARMTLPLVILALFILMLLGAPLFIVISGLALCLLFSESDRLLGHDHRNASDGHNTHPCGDPPLHFCRLPSFREWSAKRDWSGSPTRYSAGCPAGVSMIALVVCAIFTALTGATGLTIIAMGGILFPAMLRGKYPESFSLGLLTTSGTLGLLFPPEPAPDHLCHRGKGAD